MKSSYSNSRPAAGASTDRRRGSRLTAAGIAVVVSGLALIAATPADRLRLDADSASAWLPSVQRGFVGRANALIQGSGSGTTDRLAMPMSADVKTVRRDSALVIDGRPTGGVSVVDIRARKVDPVQVADTEEVDVVDGQVFRIDAQAGRVVRAADAATLVDTRGTPVRRWTVSDGALWLAVPATGSVIRVNRSGTANTLADAFPPGHDPLLVAMPGGVAVLDPTHGEIVTLVGQGDRRYRTDLAQTMSRVGAKRVSSFQIAPDGAYAVIVACGDIVCGGRFTMIAVGLADGQPTASQSLGDSGHAFGAVVLSHDRIYVSDDSTGALTVAQVRPRMSPVSSLGVAHRPTALEVFAKGSMVWANDPNGPDALAVYADRHWPITKYPSTSSSPTDTATPSPSPSPSDSASASTSPSTTPPTAGALTGPPQPPTVTATVSAVNGSYTGPCPPPGTATTYRAVISVSSGPVTVTFRWTSSNGGDTDPSTKTLTFNGTGPQNQTVTHNESFYRPGQTVNDWIAVNLLTPVTGQSNHVPYQLTCTQTVNATVSPVNGTYTGPCPPPSNATTYRAVISVSSGPVTVTFRWTSSNGGDTDPSTKTLTFPGTGPQSQTVTHNESFYLPGQTVNDWIAVNLLTPISWQSNHANYSLTCT